MGAPDQGLPATEAREHLEELARLADTAGAHVAGQIQQRIAAPHPGLYIGTGKVEELRDFIRERDATLAIFDEDLTPAQGQNLEEALGTRVMDRSELILDIFAYRARTAEAKMQVELAQLQYMLPRLLRMWTHLSRIRGGIGLRGPGETQLETDRRIIRRRITDLKRRLKGVARQRAIQRQARSGLFRMGLVGYTNTGKSSILKGLSGADLFIEDRLFATLDPATRSVDLGDGYRALVTDTVGFIRKLPHHLVASFRATLEEAREADLLCHVVDISHPNWETQIHVVQEVLVELRANERPVLVAFNKVDRLTHEEQAAIHARAEAAIGPHVFSSAVEPRGLDALLAALKEEIRRQRPTVVLAVPVTDGGSIAEVYRQGEVLERSENGTHMLLTARLTAAAVGRLRARPGVSVLAQVPM
ncbi:MAG: GTPase HflX [Gemmatimonadetes bacterium]|nr:GTPase HflX [Gemmatimonadota bacterium]